VVPSTGGIVPVARNRVGGDAAGAGSAASAAVSSGRSFDVCARSMDELSYAPVSAILPDAATAPTST
jgi:hypothetical protein